MSGVKSLCTYNLIHGLLLQVLMCQKVRKTLETGDGVDELTVNAVHYLSKFWKSGRKIHLDTHTQWKNRQL